MAIQNAEIVEKLSRRYDAGFITDIESDTFAPGLSEDMIRALSAKKEEPEWMTDWRLAAYRHFLTMPVPEWAKLQIAPIDLQGLSYYSAPKGGMLWVFALNGGKMQEQGRSSQQPIPNALEDAPAE